MHPKWTIIHGNTHRCSNEIELRIIASIRFVVWAWPSASDVSTFWLAPTMKKGKKEIHSVKIIICSFLIVKIMAVYVVLVFDCRRSWFWPNSSVCVNNSDNSKCVYVHFQASLSLTNWQQFIIYGGSWAAVHQTQTMRIIYSKIFMLDWFKSFVWHELKTKAHIWERAQKNQQRNYAHTFHPLKSWNATLSSSYSVWMPINTLH